MSGAAGPRERFKPQFIDQAELNYVKEYSFSAVDDSASSPAGTRADSRLRERFRETRDPKTTVIDWLGLPSAQEDNGEAA